MSFDKNLAINLVSFAGKSYSQLTYQVKNNGFLLENDLDGNQLLSFPGSEQIKDWLEDSEFVKVKRDGLGYLHGGFADVFDDLKKEILKSLDKNKPIVITAHSLGAAVCCIFALYLKNSGYIIKHVYTFGMPRTGNKEWYDNFKKSGIIHYRVVNGNDIVTTIPKLFYWHVGEEIHINKRGIFSWFHSSFSDHLLENYEKSLYKIMDE